MEGLIVKINTKNLVSVADANQNFSKITRLVAKNGSAIILKNNIRQYVLIEFSLFQEEVLGDEAVDAIAKRILLRYQVTFAELAK